MFRDVMLVVTIVGGITVLAFGYWAMGADIWHKRRTASAAPDPAPSSPSLIHSVRAAGAPGWTLLVVSVISWVAFPVIILLAVSDALRNAACWLAGYLVLQVLWLWLFARLTAREQ